MTTTSLRTARHMAFIPVVEDLARATRTERALLPAGSSEWEFYFGAEEAAHAFLHPERAAAKDDNWLESETAAFRDGYLTVSAQLAAALATPTPPVRLALPRRTVRSS